VGWRRRRRSWRRRLVVIRPKKIRRTCSTIYHVHNHFAKLFISRFLLFISRFLSFILCFLLCLRRFELCVLRWYVVVFVGEMSRVLLQGHELLRLGAPNGWNTTGRPQVVGRSVGEPVNPIFIGSTWRANLHPQIWIEFRKGQNTVPVSLSQPIIIGLLKIKKSNHHIQFNKHNNLQNKMVEQTYHKMLGTVINELLCPLLAVLTPRMRLHTQLHRARLTSKKRSL
jgi:hypothetical protein